MRHSRKLLKTYIGCVCVCVWLGVGLLLCALS